MAIHFYHQHRKPYGCFSNYSLHPVRIEGVLWPTTEHYFQAMKFPDDPERQQRILDTPHPGEAKRIAWEPGVRPARGWDTQRDEVMRDAVRAKFTQHADIRQILLDTGEQTLVEHTKNDSYWGDGGDGSGQNRLGQILMEIRAELLAGEAGQ